jgi:CRISPR-associated protein Cas1
LRKERGFLIVSEHKEELGRLPLDDLEVVLFAGHGMTCTGELMNTLAERCIPLIVCDQRFLPASILWPVESHQLQSGRIRAQADLSAPLRKRLWKQLVQAKILAQAEVLHLCQENRSARLDRLAREVRSGDPANAEGEAARVYWPLLFGPKFRRDRDQAGVNALLNYGYTVLRSAVARAVMLAGLHPAFGVHHCNLRDTMPLVDDLIEPFRPVVDLLVFGIAAQSEDIPAMDAAAKERLTHVTTVDMIFDGIASPVSECLLRMTRSLAEICDGTRQKLLLPTGLRLDPGAPEP